MLRSLGIALALIVSLLVPPALSQHVRAPFVAVSPWTEITVPTVPSGAVERVTACVGDVEVTMHVASFCGFYEWTGDENWLGAGWLDGDNVRVRVRLIQFADRSVLEYAFTTKDGDGVYQKAVNYGVENTSLQHAANYNGTYGAAFAFSVDDAFAGGISFHVGMCGGVPLSTFDGSVDFLSPGGMIVGGSGHSFGVGFADYGGSAVLQ